MNYKKVELLKSVREMLKKPYLNPPQVAGIGEEIFILKKVLKLDDKQYQDVLDEYIKIIKKFGLHDLLENQSKYAIKLAGVRRELIYEEMFKLFCLCDEIAGLKGIGFEVEGSLDNELKDALRYRFKREPKKAKLVAEDMFEDWKKDYWWYSENLKSTKMQKI